MWAFCSGMQRSGSTLQYQIVADLIERRNVGRRIGFFTPEEFSELHAKYNNQRHIQVIKCHSFLSEAIELTNSGNATVFCVYRDVRDVAVSLCNKYGTSIQQILKSSVLETCIANHMLWSALPGALVMRYEHMIANLTDSVSVVAEHLRLSIDPKECKEIADSYSSERQKERIERLQRALEEEGQTAGYDPDSLLHQNHMKSGKPDQWKLVFTNEQIQQFEAKFGNWLTQHGYETSSKFKTKFVRTGHSG